MPSAVSLRENWHLSMPPSVHIRASYRQQKIPCTASAWGAAVNILGRCPQGKAAPHYATHHPSPGISPATKNSPLGFCVGCSGRYPQPLPEGRSGTSVYRPLPIAGHLTGNEKVHSRLLRGARWLITSAVALRANRHLIVPLTVHPRASHQGRRCPRAAFACLTAVDTLGHQPQGQAAP